MGLGLAIKAFCKALKEPKKAKDFLEEAPPKALETQESSHLRLLTILQHTGRLVDFFKDDVSQFTDAQVGAAVRKIHQDCGKILEELVTIRPVMEEKEGALVDVLHGYDPMAIKVVGKVKGEPPYKGVLVHRGWKAHKRSLPKKIGEHAEILCPAEVEIR
jgi:hypothetical protein